MKFGLPPYYETNQSVEKLRTLDDFKQQKISLKEQDIFTVSSGNANKNVILFIHGSPGQWTAWADYLADNDLRENAFMIAVDRPGFGQSDNGVHQPSLQSQASLIMEASQKIAPSSNLIVVGHSYGGPVALRMATDYPEKIKALILLAPSIAPEYEELRWYNKWADKKFIKRYLPEPVMRSNDEIMPLKSELTKMEKKLDTLTIPVTVIQGRKDKLVPMENAQFAKDALKNSEVEIHLIENRGHFIPWEEYGLVKKTIQKYLQKPN